MSAVARQTGPTLIDDLVATAATPAIAGWLGGIGPEALIEMAKQGQDLLQLMPERGMWKIPTQLLEVGRPRLIAYLREPRPMLYAGILARLRVIHHGKLALHAAILGKPAVRGWYDSTMDRFRLHVLQQLQQTGAK